MVLSWGLPRPFASDDFLKKGFDVFFTFFSCSLRLFVVFLQRFLGFGAKYLCELLVSILLLWPWEDMLIFLESKKNYGRVFANLICERKNEQNPLSLGLLTFRQDFEFSVVVGCDLS